MRTSPALTIPGDKVQTYELHASYWTAEANEAEERGAYRMAERYRAKAQTWLDRANKAANWHDPQDDR